jgi:uncharacterized protein YacL
MEQTRRLIVCVWIAIGVQVVGQLIDVRWHATHDEFEGGVEQLQAHWLLWLGAILTLVVAYLGTRALSSSWYSGYSLLLIATVFYVLASVWHFFEHLNLRDPALPHVSIALGKVGMIVGAISASIISRPTATHESAPT